MYNEASCPDAPPINKSSSPSPLISPFASAGPNCDNLWGKSTCLSKSLK